jgi:RND family efflux transporter MFP subunit
MKPRTVLFTALLISLLLSAGCGSTGGADGKGGSRGPSAVAVATDPVETSDIKEIRFFNGQVQPVQSAVMAPKVNGRVASVAVRIGDRVKKGDILIQLDTSEISAQVRSQEADLALNRARLEMAQKNREYYRNAMENYKKLYEAGALSKEKYDEMALKYDQAMSGEFEAAVAKSEASLNEKQSLLEGSTVRSPINGVVSFVNVEPGQNVTTATQAVGVVDISTVKIRVFVADQHINRLAKGQTVEVEIPDVRSQPFAGTVAAVSPAVDPATRGYPVEIELANPDGQIKQGMFARVRLAVSESKNAVVVSVDAVVNRPEGKFVFAVQNGKAKEFKVETGIAHDGKIEIKSGGLKPGDQVVTVGHQSLVDGMAVRLSQDGKPGTQGAKPEAGKGQEGSGQKPAGGAPESTSGKTAGGKDKGAPEASVGQGGSGR